MAVTLSGLFVSTFIDALDTTQLALDLDLDTHKIALFNNSITPNYSTDTAYGSGTYATNEVSGTGWSSGGVALTGTTLTEAITGAMVFDAADVSQSTTTLSNARCAVIYADVLAGNNLIVLIDFDADYSTSAGTFAIQWAAPGSGGIFSIDLTPSS